MVNNFSWHFIVLFALTTTAIPGTPAFAAEHPTCPQIDLVNNKMLTAGMAASSLHSFAISDTNTTLLTLNFNGALLDSNFLAVLIREFGKPVKYPGLRVVNANFPDGVHLDFADVDIPLEVSGGCSNAAWNVERAHFKQDFTIRNATMPKLKGYRSHFEQEFALTGSSVTEDIDLKNVEVGKAIDLSGTRAQTISMDALRATGNVTLNSLDRLMYAEKLSIPNADVKGDIYIVGTSLFGNVSLEHSNFSGSAILSSIHVLNAISLADTRFGHDIMLGVGLRDERGLKPSVFNGPVDIEGAVVDGYINLNGTYLNLVDLGGSVARRGLTLGRVRA